MNLNNPTMIVTSKINNIFCSGMLTTIIFK